MKSNHNEPNPPQESNVRILRQYRLLTAEDLAKIGGDFSSPLRWEWLTVCILGRECGVPPYKTRIMSWDDISITKRQLTFTPRTCKDLVTRPLSAAAIQQLLTAEKPSGFLCPELQALTPNAFARAWRIMLRKAGIQGCKPLTAIAWPFYQKHKSWRRLERNHRYMRKLAEKWLHPAQAKLLGEKYLVMPSTDSSELASI